MDYKKVAKEMTKRVKREYQRKYKTKPIHENNIIYNVQMYYVLCLKVIFKDITSHKYLYQYEYDLIIRNMMNKVRV